MSYPDDTGPDVANSGAKIAGQRVLSAKLEERFVLGQQLGSGASGSVYRAYDKVRGATVALKFLTALDPASLFRFKAEFRSLANLVHPNLLQLYELLSFDDDWLLSMELIEGTDFLTYVRAQATIVAPPTQDSVIATESFYDATASLPDLPEQDSDPVATNIMPVVAESDDFAAMAASIQPRAGVACPFDETRLRSAFLQLCEGLSALHEAERLHRDLKPANVLVSLEDNRVVICDFGLALEASESAGVGHGRFETRQREVAGTLVFMSPEQARAETLTVASDWYAVGVMLYVALTGKLPFPPTLSYNSALRAKTRGRPVHPAVLAPGVPGELAELALALLHPDPRQRAGYGAVLDAFEGRRKVAVRRARTSTLLLGRQHELSLLEDAFSASCSGAPTIALVSGMSGMGKSALVRYLLAKLGAERGAIVLRARCYEREELPYKAIDPLIDALASHLCSLDHQRVLSLLPRASICYLAALFPTLERVRAIAECMSEERALEVADQRERKRLAFGALRELCKRLAHMRPLVLFIDDLQWGDRDSAPFFQELVVGPDAPAVLVVCAYRSEDEQRSPLVAMFRGLNALDESVLRLVDVKVGPLAARDAVRLASDVLAGTPNAPEVAQLIAREAAGSPFFVRELAAFVVERGVEAVSRIRLDMLIQAQLDGLARDCRDLVSIIAVASKPIAVDTVTSASMLGERAYKALLQLQARRLVLTTRSDAGERVECYHDRIRETACSALAAEQKCSLHRALAEALERQATEDSDALLEHWRGAGDNEKACNYALKGARKAQGALAFTRAADLYREALSLLATGDIRRRELQERMADALTSAGRGIEAAATLQELIPGANEADGLRFRMLATTQLLRGGKISEGFEELERAADLFGVSLPRSEPQALLMLLSRQLRIRLKERHIVVSHAAGPARQSMRLAALWQVAAAVSSADWIRGGIYGAELTLQAIRAQDPVHIAGACGLEAVTSAAANNNDRVQRMIELAEDAALSTGNLALLGRVRGMRAVCCQLLGRWRDAVKFARESQELSRRTAEQTWDLTIMTWWEIVSLAFSGDITELTRLVPQGMSDAEARGDVFAATSFRTHRCCWAWLGLDRPAVAEHHVSVAEQSWTPNGYQFQHWHMSYSRSDIDLYCGAPRASLERVQRDWGRGRLLRQVGGVRVDMLYTRGRLALAVAGETRDPSLVRRAAADGNALRRGGAPWARALGTLLLAGAASFDSPREAVRLTQEAERQFADTDMLLHVEASRIRRAQLQPGAHSEALIAASLEQVRLLGVHRPEAFLDMLAPFPLQSRGR